MNQTKQPIFKVWLIFFAVSSILTNLPSFFIGIVGGAGGLKYGWVTEDEIWWIATISWYLLVIPVSFLTFRWVAGKYLMTDRVSAPPAPSGQSTH